MKRKRHKVVVVAVIDRYIEAHSFEEAAKIADRRVVEALYSAGLTNGEVEHVVEGSYLDKAVKRLRCEE